MIIGDGDHRGTEEESRGEQARSTGEEEAASEDTWRVLRCPRILVPSPVQFRVVLEICSPDEFSVSPKPLQGSEFPGEVECLCNIEACLFLVMPYRAMERWDGKKSPIYKLKDYELMLRSLKKLPRVELQDIPFITCTVVQKLSPCVGDQWSPDLSLPGFYSDEKVGEYLEKLTKLLRDALLPFQLKGMRLGLRRGGRCLIADEMGLGKTIQAIAITKFLYGLGAYTGCLSSCSPIFIGRGVRALASIPSTKGYTSWICTFMYIDLLLEPLEVYLSVVYMLSNALELSLIASSSSSLSLPLSLSPSLPYTPIVT